MTAEDGASGIAAWHYDGHTALRHAVHLEQAGDGLLIVETGEWVAFAMLRAAGDRALPSWRHAGIAGWRIDLTQDPPAAWHGLLPRQEHHGGLIDRFGVGRTITVAAILGAAALLAFGWGTALIARLVPVRWEMAMGDVLSDSFGHGSCASAGGRAALDKLSAELGPGDPPIRIAVVDLPIVNAVALPGRQVVLFRGLIDEAESPDEVAGVLAHEIGHVERRDPMVGLVRGYGLSLLLGGMDGGALMQALMANRYSRAQERGADAAALAALGHAGISARGMAGFFDRLSRTDGPGGAVTVFLSTHPLSAERREMFLAAPRSAGRPALSAADWRQLRAICGK